MVLGAVLAGWTVMMIQVVRGPLRSGCEWALPLMIRSLAFWFVLDTAMSLVLGFPWHALFNVPIAIAIAIPLLMLRRADRQRDRYRSRGSAQVQEPISVACISLHTD